MIEYLYDWRILVGLIGTLFVILFIYNNRDKIRFPKISRKEKQPERESSEKAEVRRTDWKKFLKSMYLYSPYLQSGGVHPATEKENSRIAKRLREKGDDLSLSLAFLLDQKLIGRNITSKNPYSNNLFLTDRGFTVIENIIRDRKIVFVSLAIVFLAVVMLVSFIFNFLNDLGKINQDLLFYMFLAVVSVIVLFSIFIFKDLIGNN